MLSLAACPSTSPRAELNKLNEIHLLPSPAQVASRPWTRLPGQLVNNNATSTAADFILGTRFYHFSFFLEVFPPFHWAQEKWESQLPNNLRKEKEIQLASLHRNWYESIITRQIEADNGKRQLNLLLNPCNGYMKSSTISLLNLSSKFLLLLVWVK